MDQIILALLVMKSRTIYEIRTKFANNLNLMYSSSTGSIQAAIKKLLKAGYITYSEIIENGKYKKVYTITESGREEFEKWINAPFNVGLNKNPELAKIYFMGLSDKRNRCQRIRQYISQLEEYHQTLKLIYEEGKKIQVPKEHEDILKFQLITVKYGVDLSAFQIKALYGLLEDIGTEE